MSRVLAAEHRRAIVAATIRLMQREGVAAASTRRIAAEAGVPQATIHYVFGTKTELYRAVLQRVSENLVRAVEAGLAPHPDWTEDVTVASRAVWEIVQADTSTALLLVELTATALRDPELRDLAEGLYDSYHLLAENAVRTIAERSNQELRVPVSQIAQLAVGGLNGIVLSFLVHGDPDRAGRDFENLAYALTAVAVGPASVP
jgi:AcrR family transcriptional regulator